LKMNPRWSGRPYMVTLVKIPSPWNSYTSYSQFIGAKFQWSCCLPSDAVDHFWNGCLRETDVPFIWAVDCFLFLIFLHTEWRGGNTLIELCRQNAYIC
jgi:hypothetical protein